MTARPHTQACHDRAAPHRRAMTARTTHRCAMTARLSFPILAPPPPRDGAPSLPRSFPSSRGPPALAPHQHKPYDGPARFGSTAAARGPSPLSPLRPRARSLHPPPRPAARRPCRRCFRFEGAHKRRPVCRHGCNATHCYSQAQARPDIPGPERTYPTRPGHNGSSPDICQDRDLIFFFDCNTSEYLQ